MIVKLYRALLFVSALCLSSFFGAAVSAQDFPTRVVRIVVPLPPGGGVDSVARIIADKLSKQWSQPVIVENRPGGNAIVGSNYVAKSPSDGYTILFSTSGIFTTAKLLSSQLPFDPDTDLRPVTLAAVTPNVLMVNPKLPVSMPQELIDYARANPGELTYASQGIGTTGHLTSAYLAQVAKIDMRHVPFRGSAAAVNDVMGGHVALTWDGLISVLGIIRGGSVSALAVASRQRSPALPDVPTVIESGLPDFESVSWYGVAVPNGTPDAVVQTLSKAISRAIHEPDLSASLIARGAQGIGNSPEEFAAYIRADTAHWKQIIELAKIRID